MITTWTKEAILALAPDAPSASAGRGLAVSRKWLSLGRNERAAWGECQGSGSSPYQTRIDLGEPAFKCTCPSRKFPCKHGLGLFLLLVAEPSEFTQSEPPPWVTDWLASRLRQGSGVRAQGSGKSDSNTLPTSDPRTLAPAQARQAARRDARVSAGVQELDTWLCDLVRNGFAAAQAQPLKFWEGIASRMVDAQAPGLARLVRQMATIPSSGEGWPERLLEHAARLHLLQEGYGRLDTLPEDLQTTIRTLVGWTQSQEELLQTAPSVRDRWMVLGQAVEEEDKLRVQRTWLWGEREGRAALVLAFAPGKQPLNSGLVVETMFEADLVFFPGSYPQRALVKERYGPTVSIEALPGTGIPEAMQAYSHALTLNPWIEYFPAAVAAVYPMQHGEGWALRDADGNVLPIDPRFRYGWQLLSVSGGHPVPVVGEWNGRYFLPMSSWAAGSLVWFP